jgi:hypothetical protein
MTFYKTHAVSIPIFQLKELRLMEVEELARSYS